MRWYQCYISYLHAKVSNSYINLDNILGNYNVPDGWSGKVVKHSKGEVPGPPVWFEEEDVQEAVAGVGYLSDNQEEKDIFFYHTDHLQSTTYLTDSVGNISQFLWYAPYGEALIDEHVGSYENPYKFSGKELDENTGLYDHGARHREPASGIWYGVDPLFEQFPEVSPYHYCHANPVRLMDLNGMCDTAFFSAKVRVSVGIQGEYNIKNKAKLNLNIISVDLVSAEYTKSSVDEKGKSEYHYILEDGGVVIRNGIGVRAELPVVGTADLAVNQSFKAYNGYTTDHDVTYSDIDVAKVSFGFNSILSV